MRAVEHGFRLRVPATMLWFNLEPAEWARVCAALLQLGAEEALGGLEGEELRTVPGLTVVYRAEEQRMQVEVAPEGGTAAAAALAAVREAVPSPAAEASPIWLWAPEPFRIGSAEAEPADRVLRAARWRCARERAGEAVAAAGAALSVLDERATVALEVEAACSLTVTTPLQVANLEDRDRRAAAFGELLRRLGEPVRADYVTCA